MKFLIVSSPDTVPDIVLWKLNELIKNHFNV